MSDAQGWFTGLDPDDRDGAIAAIRNDGTEHPRNWPPIAVEEGFAATEEGYFEQLHAAAVAAARTAVAAHDQADDQQVIHAIRTIDDLDRVSNELDERVAEWARTSSLPSDAGTAAIASSESDSPTEARIVDLATTIERMRADRASLVDTVGDLMRGIAPNLTALAGPLLGARLIALAGGLEQLAKQPSSTVQVLGAEDALFAHLRGDAPSPKHGIIFTHEYVRETDPNDRGSAARALAGKLTIAARVDHYAGDRRPDIEAELDDRIATIRERSR